MITEVPFPFMFNFRQKGAFYTRLYAVKILFVICTYLFENSAEALILFHQAL